MEPAAKAWMKNEKWKVAIKKLKDKVNEEQQQLMAEEKQNLAEKKSKLEEEIKNINEDQRSIDQQIEAFMKMSEELKKQRKRLVDQKEEAKEISEANEKNLKAVDAEVRNQTGNMVEKKAKGYLKLKDFITESNDRLVERKKGHQHVELMTHKLMSRTREEVDKLKKRKQEIENHVVEIQKQLNEVET
ncbi:hypothetical protein ILYODFUR_036934 [Ilyodon furcidens]|uniref:Uncharacterized protein n=1 Tax=Ilyodon furcidens TaxID=33524 RepID=A0ABV0T5L5_9TELE